MKDPNNAPYLVPYMERTRLFYRAQGFEKDYKWAHFETVPFSMPKKDAPAGARTLDHRLIRPKRCQLRHKSSRMMQNDASGGFRTHDLGIMRPTRCQLRHRG